VASAQGLIKQAGSWDSFRALVAKLPNTKAKGDAFEHLCAAFLRSDPRYVAELKSVWLRSELPAAIAKQLNLPATDEGIDGIAQTRDGAFWSFQCKYLDDPRSTLTKNALDGFSHLSLTHCKGISKALVLHTSSAPIRKHRLLGISEVGLREFEELDEAAWVKLVRAGSLKGHAGLAPKPRAPRPHQKAAVRAVTAHLKRHDRGRVLMACGSGKSLVGFWVQAALKAKQVVVAVPSLSLLNQTLKEWATEWAARGETVRYTAVCGDESAADLGDSFVGHAYELGIDTYTDPKLIAARLKALRNVHHVVFTTYQSGHRLAAAARLAKATFDIGILDEAHKTVGQRGDRFTTLLSEKAIRIRKRIAMTATERVLRGDNDDVLSMDDPKVYGEVAFQYSFKAAIKDGVICDYKIVTLAVAESRMRELIAENARLLLQARGKQDKVRLAQDLAAGELLARAFDTFGVRHAISFHRSISAASAFAEQWGAVDQLVKRKVRSGAYHVSSRVPTGKRVELLREFRDSDAALITNARCLTEGVDVPNVDAVLFADPRRSTVDIVQAVGRALRKSKDKPQKIGYVLVPVLVQDGHTVEQFLESSAFKEVGRVIATLSTHDERIAEEFRASERGKASRGERSESRIVFTGDIPVGVRMDAEQFAAQCRARVWQRVGRLNWRPFEEAREWVRALGLGSYQQWRRYCRGGVSDKPPLPADIPVDPRHQFLGSHWHSWGDWLGTPTIAPQFRQYRPYEAAERFVRALKLASVSEWRQYCKDGLTGRPPLPSDIPRNAYNTYRGRGWSSWGSWLGSDVVAPQKRVYMSFTKAQRFARSLGLTSKKQWKDYCAEELVDKPPLPSGMPRYPNHVYRGHGWESWGEWLGTGAVHPRDRQYRSFSSARSFARRLGLGSKDQWSQYCAGRTRGKPPLPSDIPVSAAAVYAKRGWSGWSDWLGNGRGPRSNTPMPRKP
jgi:superfamily II DNA or RNA helicase